MKTEKRLGLGRSSVAIVLLLILGGLTLKLSEKNAEPTVDPVPSTNTPVATELPAVQTPAIVIPSIVPASVNLAVPYVNEAPDDDWTGPWKNACEEATIVMVDNFYAGAKTVSIAEAKIYLQKLFDFEDKTFGSNANTDVKKTLVMVENVANFKARIVELPSLEDIKKELDAGHPVITFHRGFDLHNANIPFLRTGSSYHTLVVKGYNDLTKQFITNDPGDSKQGPDHLYDYNVLMESLHDYNYATSQVDLPARVLFTSPR